MNQRIMQTLESLGAALPWDTVDLWIGREPEGRVSFTAHVGENNFGCSWAFGHGDTPEQAAQDLLAQVKDSRDPEKARAKKVKELQEQIDKLQSVVLGMPPYRPNRELDEHAPSLVPELSTIDV